MSDWVELSDTNTGRKYYANKKTRETTWVKPPELEEDVPPPPPPPDEEEKPPEPSFEEKLNMAELNLLSVKQELAKEKQKNKEAEGKITTLEHELEATKKRLHDTEAKLIALSHSDKGTEDQIKINKLQAEVDRLTHELKEAQEKSHRKDDSDHSDIEKDHDSPRSTTEVKDETKAAEDAQFWKELKDPSTGRSYYHNTKTGEVTWTKPAVTHKNPHTDLAALEEEAKQWTEGCDPVTSKPYFLNKKTGETSWVKPAVLEQLAAATAKKERESTSEVASPRQALRKQQTISTIPRTASAADAPLMSPRVASRSLASPRAMEHENLIVVYTDNSECIAPLGTDTLGKYTMSQYAEKFFALHKKGMFGTQTVDEMISHTKKPLTTSLHKGSKQLEEDGQQTFRNITSYSGERKSSKGQSGHVDKLCRMGIQGEELLRDEIYAQLTKQTYRNTESSSNLNTWRLLALCLGVFPPSKRFATYLKAYLQQSRDYKGDPEVPEYALFCEEVLFRCMKNGARETAPRRLEVECVEKRLCIPIGITFSDGSKTTVACQAQTTVQEICDAVARHLKLPNRDSPGQIIWALYEVNFDESGNEVVDLEMPYSARILDIRSRWLDRNSHKEESDCKFLFKARLFFTKAMQNLEDEALDKFFIQGVADVVQGHYSTSSKEAITLAALQAQAIYGEDIDLNTVMKDESLKKFFPKACLNQYMGDSSQLRKLVATEREALKGVTQAQSKHKYLEFVQQFPVYGASFFRVQFVSERFSEDAIFGISERGFFILHAITKQLIQKAVKLEDIATVEHNNEMVVFNVNPDSKKYKFSTSYVQQITKLLTVYCQEIGKTL